MEIYNVAVSPTFSLCSCCPMLSVSNWYYPCFGSKLHQRHQKKHNDFIASFLYHHKDRWQPKQHQLLENWTSWEGCRWVLCLDCGIMVYLLFCMKGVLSVQFDCFQMHTLIILYQSNSFHLLSCLEVIQITFYCPWKSFQVPTLEGCMSLNIESNSIQDASLVL